MTQYDPTFRSPRLLDRRRSALLVVDMQQKLLPVIGQHDTVLWNVSRLIRGATALEVPVGATEQYPKGLGATAAEIADLLPPRHEKMDFSAAVVRPLISDFADREISQIAVCGIEAHVCVLQTALDLGSEGFDVFVVADAVGSRAAADRAAALDRIRDEGLSLVTTEGALFEWCQTAADPAFKTIRGLVQETQSDFLAHNAASATS